MSVFIAVVIVIYGVIAYLLGRHIGRKEGSDLGMKQFCTLISVYDESGELMNNLTSLLERVDRMSIRQKEEFIKKHIEKYGNVDFDGFN